MKTNFKNLTDLKTNIEVGQMVYIDNYVKPELSRVTKVVRKQSYFFTVEKKGKESWIVTGATEIKNLIFVFKQDYERVDIFFKKDNKPYLSLIFNETIIKGKQI